MWLLRSGRKRKEVFRKEQEIKKQARRLKKEERVRKEGLESNKMKSGVMVKNFFFLYSKDRFEIRIKEK